MTELAAPATDGSDTGDESAPADVVAARIRERAERVRRRELGTALQRLESRGELTPAERRVVVRLSTRLADSLVEGWAAKLDAEDVDPDAVLALLAE